MRDTLLLNAGASWAAYQIGAIEHIVGERGITFDSYVGCGIGAMNAALLACGEYDALIGFWNSISTRRLVRPNVTSPWKALARNSPQRRFVKAHVREQALIDRGTTLAFTTFDLMTGARFGQPKFPGSRVRFNSSPCRRNGCASTSVLRSTCILLTTMVLAGSRSNVRSTLRIQ